jgi:hypothetical protein
VPLLTKPAASIDQVVGVMTAIEQALPTSDGLWWFNHVYLRVTLSVRAAMSSASSFGDRVFLERLDVVFANLYFDALAAGETTPGAAPHAWRPLLSSRTLANVHPLQFALAGMNAHINRDLPWGIVTVFEQLGGEPRQNDGRHDDFVRVNDLLEAVEQEIKEEFATGVVGKVDALTAPVDDRIAMWNVRAAREAAWTNAEVLWALKPTPALQRDYFDRLDRFTGFAARGLLAPIALPRT